MRKITDGIFGLALFAVFYFGSAWVAWPWIAAAVVGIPFLWIIATTLIQGWRWRRAWKRRPPPAPLLCPACGGGEHDFKSCGLWDGIRDPVTGNRAHGSFAYGVCKACGTRWAQQDEAPPYPASAEEWSREIEQPEARRAAELALWTEHHARRTDATPPVG